MDRRMLDFMVLVVAALVTAACATGAEGVLYVQSAPPPVLYEVVSASPGPGYVWVGGYWEWTGVEYVWVAGRWQRPPGGYTVWVAPRYERREGGWSYRPGHWDRGRGRGKALGRGHGERE